MKLCFFAPAPLVLLLGCAHFRPSHPSAGPAAATVNGRPISRAAISELQSQNERNKVTTLDAYDELVKAELFSQEASRDGVDQATEAELENERRFILARAAREHFVATQQVSDAELKQAYEQRAADDTLEIHASHILVRKESEAEDIIARLKKGEDFGRLAITHSIDPSSEGRHGDIGWFRPRMMVKEFSTALLALKDGETSAVPVHSIFGWHVIWRQGSRKVDPPTFDQVKANLQFEIIQERLKRHIEDLQKTAKIVKLSN